VVQEEDKGRLSLRLAELDQYYNRNPEELGNAEGEPEAGLDDIRLSGELAGENCLSGQLAEVDRSEEIAEDRLSGTLTADRRLSGELAWDVEREELVNVEGQSGEAKMEGEPDDPEWQGETSALS
jgi:hypothetical protein